MINLPVLAALSQLAFLVIFTLHAFNLYFWMKNQAAWQKRQDQEILKVYGHLKALWANLGEISRVSQEMIKVQQSLNKDLHSFSSRLH